MRDHMGQLRDEHTEELLDRYFLHNLPPDEADAIRAALEQAGVDLDAAESLRALWNTRWRARTSDAARWASLAGRLQLDSASSTIPSVSAQTHPAASIEHHIVQNGRTMPWRYLLGVAAAALAIVGVGIWTPAKWTNGTEQPEERSSASSVYTTADGERATISLSDGSQVLLNVGSRLEVPDDYNRGARTLRLYGEAIFTVRHAQGSPFTVIAGPSTTRVLGTRFAVRHYSSDSAASIAVQDGKVAVGPVVLTANQATVVTALGPSQVMPATSGQFGFARGVLELDHVLFPDAIPELNRWYNADIRLGDSTLVNRRIVGSFETGSLTDLISILEFTFHVRVVREGRVLTLYQGR